jgi:hypothetical protein
LLESHATVAGLRGKICWSEQHTLLIRLGSSKKVLIQKVVLIKVLAMGNFRTIPRARVSVNWERLAPDWQNALSDKRISDTTASFVTRIARA